MYELIILSLLMRGAFHGYLIAKIVDDIIGPVAKISHGSFYPLLTRLEASGMIAHLADDLPAGRRRQRPYRITDGGRERFHQLMLDTTSNPGEYQRLFWLKMSAIDLLAPAEQQYLLNHYVTYCQMHLFHLDAEMASLLGQDGADEGVRVSGVRVMQHRRRQWLLEVEGIRHLAGELGLEMPAVAVALPERP